MPHQRFTLRPEDQLLVNLSRTHLDETVREEAARLLSESPDWEHLSRQIDRHHVQALAYHHLKRLVPEAVPPALMQRLKEWAHAVTRHNLILTEHLRRLTDALDMAGVAFLPFKGPLLAQSAYGSLSLRECGDLDVLIRPADYAAAERALAGAGFAPVLHLSPARKRLFLFLFCYFPFASTPAGVSLELHTGLSARRYTYLDRFDHFLERSVPAGLAGMSLRSLSAPDLFVVLSIHGTKHMWKNLKWSCDLAELLRTHPDLDWDAVFREADVLKAERMVHLALLLLRELYRVALPPAVAARADRDGYAHVLARQALRLLFETPQQPLSKTDIFSYRVHSWRSPEAKIRYFSISCLSALARGVVAEPA